MDSNRESLEPERDASCARCRALWTDAFLARLVRRDDDAWDQVKRCYGPYFYRRVMSQLADHADAEDVVQESFLGFMKDIQRGDVRDPHGLFTRIVSNQTVSVIRRRQRQRKRVSPLSRECDPPARTEVEPNERAAALLVAAEGWPDGMRELFRMRFVERLSNKEIAEHLGISIGAVAARVSRMYSAAHDGLAVT
jgi:RNA polymerase sigma factor (sigma-70 family)